MIISPSIFFLKLKKSKKKTKDELLDLYISIGMNLWKMTIKQEIFFLKIHFLYKKIL